jgi:hypothetical protein
MRQKAEGRRYVLNDWNPLTRIPQLDSGDGKRGGTQE